MCLIYTSQFSFVVNCNWEQRFLALCLKHLCLSTNGLKLLLTWTRYNRDENLQDGLNLWVSKFMFKLPNNLQQINEILRKNCLKTFTARQKTLITEVAKTRRVLFAEGHLAANNDLTSKMFSNKKRCKDIF